ncbi:hypothetical protein N7492_002097 [Penicillium capsulatum]|uniref:Clock-controlled protein 6 n=1 Tax=Penicillium capsulatum TaxID=69766 RepID=A0A9W9IJE3_9EURO|nr:hypothetical protein N7492_002097 [Penicillium capsulatum]KAJ6123290.1 hypothetical protein N7512_005755 [Penicillium capsulatum]
MRFSIAALTAALVAGVSANASTEVVTQYTTYCPEATSIVHGSHTYSISTPGHITFTNGPYTVTRPLMTQTVTQCNKCASSTPLPTTPVRSPSTPAVASTPYVPTGAGPQASGTSAPSSGASPSQTPYNAAGRTVAGAGAGLAAVFGAAVLLL